MIDQTDITEVKTLVKNDQWLKLISLMQDKKILVQTSPKEIVAKINDVFERMESQNDALISVDLERIDKIIRKQYTNRAYIPLDIGDEYLSQLESLS